MRGPALPSGGPRSAPWNVRGGIHCRNTVHWGVMSTHAKRIPGCIQRRSMYTESKKSGCNAISPLADAHRRLRHKTCADCHEECVHVFMGPFRKGSRCGDPLTGVPAWSRRSSAAPRCRSSSRSDSPSTRPHTPYAVPHAVPRIADGGSRTHRPAASCPFRTETGVGHLVREKIRP